MLAPDVVAGESDDVFQRGDDLEAVVKRRFTLGFDLDHFVIEQTNNDPAPDQGLIALQACQAYAQEVSGTK